MIIEFSVANYRSIDQIQTLNFHATELESLNESVDQRNVMNIDGNRYLKIIGTYGANASGKTNFIKALIYFKGMVTNSVLAEGYSVTGVYPFRKSESGKTDPSYFQIVLLLNGKKYRYGFTLDINGLIVSEWLSGPAEKNETFYFRRTRGSINTNAEWFEEGFYLPADILRPDALFLSFCSSYNGPISKEIRGFLTKEVTIEVANFASLKSSVNEIFARSSPYSLTTSLSSDGNEELILTWLKEVGLKFQAGGLCLYDEIDSNVHPSLLQKIIKLFQNPLINKANAQLLFTSHDTNLMNPKIMRRDQFYFAEKTIYDATTLYSLADLKGIRNDADFASQYLAGMYGALPVMGGYLEEEESGQNPHLTKE